MTLVAVPKPSTVRNAAHLKAVAALPCVLWTTGLCFGYVVAHHVGAHGTGIKASDLSTAPLCVRHHRETHDFSGYFKGFDRAQMEAWEVDAVAQTLATLEGLKAGREVVW